MTVEQSNPIEIEQKQNQPFRFLLVEIILISLMSTINVGFDIVVSPALKSLLSHIITGIFIMVPFNFLFMSITKFLIPRFGSLTVYMTIFGVLSIPTELFGAAGIIKILIGAFIGILLDLSFILKKRSLKIITGSIVGSIFWWIITFSIWQAFGFPFVKAFSNLLNAASPLYSGIINLGSIIHLPIESFNGDFFIFCILCGLLSAIPVLIACIIGYSIFIQIKKTALYQRLNSLQ